MRGGTSRWPRRRGPRRSPSSARPCGHWPSKESPRSSCSRPARTSAANWKYSQTPCVPEHFLSASNPLNRGGREPTGTHRRGQIQPVEACASTISASRSVRCRGGAVGTCGSAAATRRCGRPWREVLRISTEGIPHLSPGIVLLFKAKYHREKDEADLRSVLPVSLATGLRC